jgi:hypothetical protein
MPTFRDDPAAYMREYRARKRAERDGQPFIDKSLPRNAHLTARPAELATVRAKVAAIGPGAVITKTAGRLDVLTNEAWEARQNVAAPRPSMSGGKPSRELTAARPPLQGEVISPPPSMRADGGAPPRRYAANASVAEATAMMRAHATEQARINAETARRLAALEHDIAEMKQSKAAAARAGEVVQAFLGLFQLAVGGR